MRYIYPILYNAKDPLYRVLRCIKKAKNFLQKSPRVVFFQRHPPDCFCIKFFAFFLALLNYFNVIDLSTTGVTGLSPADVGTLFIAVTTSMPAVTLPNTV
jgi:hypothetical protein